jgi:hypothetical protein
LDFIGAKPNKSVVETYADDSQRQTEFIEKLFMDLVVKCGMPFSIVEKEGFKEFIKFVSK